MTRVRNETWAVTVYRNGEAVVTIETNLLAGRDISAEDEQAIRTAATHLLAFIGEPTPARDAVGSRPPAHRTGPRA